MMNLAIMVYDKYPVKADTHCPVGDGISVSVPETCVERVEFVRKEVSDVFQRCYLEHLRLPMNDLSLEGPYQTIWTQNHRTIWHHKNLVLNDPLDIVSCVICLADGP